MSDWTLDIREHGRGGWHSIDGIASGDSCKRVAKNLYRLAITHGPVTDFRIYDPLDRLMWWATSEHGNERMRWHWGDFRQRTPHESNPS